MHCNQREVLKSEPSSAFDMVTVHSYSLLACIYKKALSYISFEQTKAPKILVEWNCECFQLNLSMFMLFTPMLMGIYLSFQLKTIVSLLHSQSTYEALSFIHN